MSNFVLWAKTRHDMVMPCTVWSCPRRFLIAHIEPLSESHPDESQDLSDRHAAGTHGGGSPFGGLAGTNVRHGDPVGGELDELMGGEIPKMTASKRRPKPVILAEQSEGRLRVNAFGPDNQFAAGHDATQR